MKILLIKLGALGDVLRTTPLLTAFKKKYSGKKLSESEWISTLATNPILMERPIIVKGNRAVIGRPTENIYKLIKK